MSDMKQRMQRGELYISADPQLEADFARTQEIVERYNATPHARAAERAQRASGWLQLVLIAHDLLAWTQRLTLTGELARCEPSACATDMPTLRLCRP